MNKQHLSILTFATLLCMMLFGAVSCKKDGTLDPDKADFFIDVDFLPETETNGEVAPRLMANFNDEMVMIELRPNADTLIETVLFLCQDHEAYMMCGNKELMVLAPYDLETNTPSRDVLLVTPIDDDALVLTKGFMDWNTNTMVTGDMMVLPIDDNFKSYGKSGGTDGEIREFFFNHLVKPLAKSFEKVEGYCGFFGSRAKLVFSYIRITTVTGLTNILYSDDPAELASHMEQVITTETASGVQSGVLNSFPRKYHEMASKIIAAREWYRDDGHGKVNNYEGGVGGNNVFHYGSLYHRAYNMTKISTPAVPSPPFIVNLNVENVTENSAYLKGSYRNTSNITPVRMGYIIRESDGFEHTQQDMNFNGVNVMGLQKATKYTAFAYVQSMGNRVLSPGVPLWTLGFEASPSSLTFPAEGDTQSVDLSYSPEDITRWDITSKPSWCNITKNGDRTFSVKVGKSKEMRSGTITVTGYSNALGNVTWDVTVTQLSANGWDGTAWLFTGTLTTNYPDSDPVTEETALTLVVNSVSNNGIEFSFAQALSAVANGYSDNYTVDGNGNLVYTATATGSDSHANCRVSFVRTGLTTATADFYYKETANQVAESITMFGTLQGTMTNAKEIKDYETTINFKEGLLRPSIIGQ